MTWLDRYLQSWRIRIALRELPQGARALDIGTYDARLFRLAKARGLGIDPELCATVSPPGVHLVKGSFPEDLPPLADESFDAATALAVVEHIPECELQAWRTALARLVARDGMLVMTVPAPTVDKILHVLMRLHLVAGIEVHQHHGFRPSDLDAIFTAPLWERVKHRTFQLGLNHLYVYKRTQHPAAQRPPSRLPADEKEASVTE